MKGRRSRALTAYLRSRLAVILVLVLCTLLFVLVLSLYNVETEPAVYAGALCLLGLGVLLIIDLSRFLNKRKTLLMIEEGLPETLRHLPSPTGSLEEDYQALLRDMARAVRRQDQPGRPALSADGPVLHPVEPSDQNPAGSHAAAAVKDGFAGGAGAANRADEEPSTMWPWRSTI